MKYVLSVLTILSALSLGACSTATYTGPTQGYMIPAKAPMMRYEHVYYYRGWYGYPGTYAAYPCSGDTFTTYCTAVVPMRGEG